MSEKTKRLTLKQRRFLASYLRTANATLSAKEAGYRCQNDNGYACVGHQNVIKLQIPLTDLMNAAGLDIGRLVRCLKEGLEATKTQFFRDQALHTCPDWSVRLKYLVIAFRLHGLLPYRQEVAGPGGAVEPIRYEVLSPPGIS